jgi:hypothetical protein
VAQAKTGPQTKPAPQAKTGPAAKPAQKPEPQGEEEDEELGFLEENVPPVVAAVAENIAKAIAPAEEEDEELGFLEENVPPVVATVAETITKTIAPEFEEDLPDVVPALGEAIADKIEGDSEEDEEPGYFEEAPAPPAEEVRPVEEVIEDASAVFTTKLAPNSEDFQDDDDEELAPLHDEETLAPVAVTDVVGTLASEFAPASDEEVELLDDDNEDNQPNAGFPTDAIAVSPVRSHRIEPVIIDPPTAQDSEDEDVALDEDP